MDLKDTLIRLLGLEKIIGHLGGFVESKVALIRLEVRDEVSSLVSKGLVTVVIFFVAFLFLLFASLAVAHLINHYTGNEYTGYVWIAGFYGFLGVVFFMVRKPLCNMLEARMKESIKRRQQKSQ